MIDAKNTQPLPVADVNALAGAMNQKYASLLDERRFQITAQNDKGSVTVKVICENPDQSYHYPVEARINHVQEEMDAAEAALFLIDYVDLYFNDYFGDDEDLFLPIDWKDTQYDAVDFQIRGQVLNLKLERMADEFLATASEVPPADQLH